MQERSNLELLRDYAENGDERAFHELVARTTDFTYSAAFRQTSDHALACDISQIIFTQLARKAAAIHSRLASDGSLLGWLFNAVRYEAFNQSRSDRRRRAREERLMPEEPSNGDALNWDQISPALDAALAELAEPDREALLLRFFKTRDLRSVGGTLGISADAAQKRVTRALQRLRENLSRRGIVTGSAVAFAAALSAHTICAVPASLALTLSTSALAISTTPVIAATAKTITMTLIQKSLVTTVLVLAVGTGVFQARQSSKLRHELVRLKEQSAEAAPGVQTSSAELQSKIAGLQAENARLRRDAVEVPRLRGELAAARRDLRELANAAAGKSDPFVQQALKWKANEARLRQLFEDRPDQRIPELRLVSGDAWLNSAKDADLDGEEGARKAMADMRRFARNIFVNQLSDALGKFVAQNDGRLPTDVSQLKPFFDSPVDDDLLASYRMANTGNIRDLPRADWNITNNIVDPDFDTRWGIRPGGFGILPNTPDRLQSYMDQLQSAYAAYADANNGQSPTDLSQLKTFLKTPEQQNAFRQLEQLRSAKQ